MSKRTIAAPDYSKGKIYIISNSVNDFIYIGATCSSLNKKFNLHLSTYTQPLAEKDLAATIKEVGASKFKITLIKNYPCNSRAELVKELERVKRKKYKHLI